MKKVLIVEGEHDKEFIGVLIKQMNINNISIEKPLCTIDECEYLEGFDKTKLSSKLRSYKEQIKNEIDIKIGILVDLDDPAERDNFKTINEALNEVFNIQLSDKSKFEKFSIDDTEFQLGCFLMGIDGQGELTTVLKEIIKNDIPTDYAKCLENWKKCIETKNLTIRSKDFVKEWVAFFMKYDIECNKKYKKMKIDYNKKVGNNLYLRNFNRDIWNFDHECLNDLKNFLTELAKDN